MARRDEVWEEVLGTWLQTIWAAGRDVLINGLNHYLNFGFINGVDGYGIRDNNGSMESKNSGGAWGTILSSTVGNGAGVIFAGSFKKPETPGGAIDGTNVTYSLSYVPVKYSGILVVNGTPYEEDVDFTIVAGTSTITMTTAIPLALAGMPFWYKGNADLSLVPTDSALQLQDGSALVLQDGTDLLLNS